MIYTIHVGPREQEWPPKVAEASTRSAAQDLGKDLLRAAPPNVTKAQVRHAMHLLDTYGKLPTGTIRHVHSVRQRDVAPTAPTLPL